MSLYWRTFNFLVRRVVASGFMVFGVVIAIINGPSLLPGGTIDVQGSPSTNIVMRVAAVLLPLLVAGLGIALFRVSPFEPRKHGDGRG